MLDRIQAAMALVEGHAEHVMDAATLNLSTDFAQALESATDWLLATGYGLRRLVFSRAGVGR